MGDCERIRLPTDELVQGTVAEGLIRHAVIPASHGRWPMYGVATHVKLESGQVAVSQGDQPYLSLLEDWVELSVPLKSKPESEFPGEAWWVSCLDNELKRLGNKLPKGIAELAEQVGQKRWLDKYRLILELVYLITGDKLAIDCAALVNMPEEVAFGPLYASQYQYWLRATYYLLSVATAITRLYKHKENMVRGKMRYYDRVVFDRPIAVLIDRTRVVLGCGKLDLLGVDGWESGRRFDKTASVAEVIAASRANFPYQLVEIKFIDGSLEGNEQRQRYYDQVQEYLIMFIIELYRYSLKNSSESADMYPDLTSADSRFVKWVRSQWLYEKICAQIWVPTPRKIVSYRVPPPTFGIVDHLDWLRVKVNGGTSRT